MNVEHEVKLLVEEIKRLGSPNADGQVSVKFGVLFSDDRCANIFEGNKVSEKFLNITLFPQRVYLQNVQFSNVLSFQQTEQWQNNNLLVVGDV